MNEASSKYVDQIAVEKLLTEKLSKVHHFPQEKPNTPSIELTDLKNIEGHMIKPDEKISGDVNEFTFNSLINSGYEENDIVNYIYFGSKSEVTKGNMIFIHGLYEDNTQIYNFFISMLNEKGINVYLLMLPFHYDRKPKKSLFSGEYFWSGDIDRSVTAFKQSLFDLYALYQYVKSKSDQKLIISGFSMGGGITLTLACTVSLDGVFVINPVSNITSLVWNSKLFSPVKNDFELSGLHYNEVKSRFQEFEPLDREKLSTPLSHIAMGSSIYDQINDPENYELLINKWEMENVYKYKAGHLNILRVPKLANDIDKLYFEN